MKIAFVVPYPSGVAPSQRFRFEQYLSLLRAEGNSIGVHSFFTNKAWKMLYRKDTNGSKILFTLIGFVRRVGHLFLILPSDIVFIHREASPLGPPLFEWIIRFLLRKKIIYDFDDAIWLSDSGPNDGVRVLRNPRKVLKIARWSSRISAGNAFLSEFISPYNARVTVNPTTIDLGYHKPPAARAMSSVLRLGWTGTHSTMKYLDDILPILRDLRTELDFELVIISNSAPSFNYPWVHYTQWNKETEIKDLSSFDIGIMPLRDDLWSKGKCGFKLLQYMSLEIPAVASAVGVNTSILSQSDAGILCFSESDWKEALRTLISEAETRKKMGILGRRFVRDNYSVASNRLNFLSLFEIV